VEPKDGWGTGCCGPIQVQRRTCATRTKGFLLVRHRVVTKPTRHLSGVPRLPGLAAGAQPQAGRTGRCGVVPPCTASLKRRSPDRKTTSIDCRRISRSASIRADQRRGPWLELPDGIRIGNRTRAPPPPPPHGGDTGKNDPHGHVRVASHGGPDLLAPWTLQPAGVPADRRSSARAPTYASATRPKAYVAGSCGPSSSPPPGRRTARLEEGSIASERQRQRPSGPVESRTATLCRGVEEPQLRCVSLVAAHRSLRGRSPESTGSRPASAIVQGPALERGRRPAPTSDAPPEGEAEWTTLTFPRARPRVPDRPVGGAWIARRAVPGYPPRLPAPPARQPLSGRQPCRRAWSACFRDPNREPSSRQGTLDWPWCSDRWSRRGAQAPPRVKPGANRTSRLGAPGRADRPLDPQVVRPAPPGGWRTTAALTATGRPRPCWWRPAPAGAGPRGPDPAANQPHRRRARPFPSDRPGTGGWRESRRRAIAGPTPAGEFRPACGPVTAKGSRGFSLGQA